MNKQLLIVGFHRSGTSMLAQELNKAGLNIGERLMGASFSNPDGHFEDIYIVNLHDAILKYNNTNWQYEEKINLKVPDFFVKEMKRIVDTRNKKYNIWGFKDPRSALFLDKWDEVLDNGYYIIIYRHFYESVYSLINRASKEILFYPNKYALNFWKDKNLAYNMWLAYNKKILDFYEKNKEKCLLISHDAVINGYPFIEEINKKFGFDLKTDFSSAIKKDYISFEKNDMFVPESLDELNEVWNRLQEASLVPAREKKYYCSDNYVNFSYLKDEILKYTVSHSSVLEELNDFVKNKKWDKLRDKLNFYINIGVDSYLIEKLKNMEYENENVQFLLGDIYRLLNDKENFEKYYLMGIAVANTVYPRYYAKLAKGYLDFFDFDKAEFFIKKAIKLNSLNSSFFAIYSDLYKLKYQYDKALSFLDEAIKIEQNKKTQLNYKIKKCEIFDVLEENEKLRQELKEIKSFESLPDWIKNRMLYFENNVNSYISLDERIKTFLRTYNYLEILSFLLKDLSEDMKKDLIYRLYKNMVNLKKDYINKNECFISFVVDKGYYYQAEILLNSLKKIGVKKDNILVHCVEEIDEKFIKFLEKNGYKYKLVKPYLDKKYCNKLTQLESFEDIGDKKGVLLLDTDLFLLDFPKIEDNGKFAAKIVDAPNPPLHILKNIFNQAKITFPETVHTDWKIKDNLTVSSNFNGGVYFIPKRYISKIYKSWKKWAEWLYEKRDELFEKEPQKNHIDQIAMSLVIENEKIPFSVLSTNDNYPIHFDKECRYFNENEKIRVLHYHNVINNFGLFDIKIEKESVKNAIIEANLQISEIKSEFLTDFKKSLLPDFNVTYSSDFLKKIEKRLDKLRDKKIIFHAGTPKTGTTSLQFYLDKNYEKLKENGILYPKSYLNTPAPKHQWIVNGLKDKSHKLFFEKFDESLKQMDEDTKIIIFSTEGIYNHWWDFDFESKYFFKFLSDITETEIWVFFRNLISFAESLYKQYIKNPRVPKIECYGKDLSFSEMMENKWFINHLDYMGFLLESDEIFTKVNIFQKNGNIIKNFINELNLELDIDFEYKNQSLTKASVEILRIINRYSLTFEDKERKILKLIYELDEIMKNYSSLSVLTEKDRELLKPFENIQCDYIKQRLVRGY